MPRGKPPIPQPRSYDGHQRDAELELIARRCAAAERARRAAAEALEALRTKREQQRQPKRRTRHVEEAA